MSLEVRPAFRTALNDLRWLLNRGYPERPSVTLVGDRYRLSRTERAMLYRGVCSDQTARRRARRIVGVEDVVGGAGAGGGTGGGRGSRGGGPGGAGGDSARSAPQLVIDGYNVLFTVIHYIQGKRLFRCLDGFIRDTGEGSGRITKRQLFREAAEKLAGIAARLSAAGVKVDVYLDAQMTRSRDHVTALREAAADQASTAGRAAGATEAAAAGNAGKAGPGIPDANPATAPRFHLVDRADHVLKECAATATHLGTADSELIDRTAVPICDVGGEIVVGSYSGRILDLRELLAER